MDVQMIFDMIGKWFPIVTGFIGTFALIATLTPNKADDKIVQFLLDLVNFFGANVGKAANKEG